MEMHLSPWDMVTQADIIVQAVMGGLVLASVLCWTIALAKWLELSGFTRRARTDLVALRASKGLDATLSGPCAPLLAAARDEVMTAPGGPEGVKERTAWRLQRIIANNARSLSRGTGMLATIGSTAPFVGLFGTVWGIMNSFIGIARSQTTNLAVVAPGIAEALLATAIGLVAAIPAVVLYNAFARAIAGRKALMADAETEVMRLLSRALDQGSRPTRPLRVVAE
ncbi:tonB-system energizer ExbB [Sabulicella glaciei]|uniref:Biopolymer transport protein ExbB n=1 Tax=Sabulicella glaciei TaxID=2984948 RepID=A0ABT3P0S3_9PROT|nr:tonB-system energizer ExbB [Roseococcus sp. MDT2-1-1]MCW8087996.1 tonB-system energizer ExbB [Roseococcus sp. MDT2-1-1]